MPTKNPPVITRFAPSPTGHLHIGGVRTALFCWAYARRHGGHFALRIEDTDQARSSESSARGILEDLAWCGIEWDEGPELAVAGRSIGGDPRRCVGTYYQSQRLEIYNKVIEQMLERDLAYPAFDTSEALIAARKESEAKKETHRYKRLSDYDRAGALSRLRAGEACVIRFNNPGEVVRVEDSVLGEIKFEPEHTDDFIIRKADGFPTYHFAVVVDDEQMGVTHVLRGQEHLNNTPRHVALQKALGYRTPVYAHLPLIFNMDGTKMSKRDKDKAAREAVKKSGLTAGALAGELSRIGVKSDETEMSIWLEDKKRQLPTEALQALARMLRVGLPEIDVDDFRRAGYLPEVVCNYVALLGWNPGMKNSDGTDLERFDMKFLSEHFALERIGKTNSKFDRVKLASFNQQAIGMMRDEELLGRFEKWCEMFEPGVLERVRGERRLWLVQAVKPRVKTLSEIVSRTGPCGFVMLEDDGVSFDAGAVEKALKKEQELGNGERASGAGLLKEFAGELERVEPFTPEKIEEALKGFVDRRCPGKMGLVAQPIRVAVTGTTVSPAVGHTLGILGRGSAMARIERCLQNVG